MFPRLLLCAAMASLGLSGCDMFDKKEKAATPELEKKKKEKPKEPLIKDQSNDPMFLSFVGRLRTAVSKRDRRAMAELMAPEFGYRWDQGASGETPFDFWDKNDAWPELEKLLAGRFVPHEDYMVAPPQFALDSTFRGYRMGLRQINGAWRWVYFVAGEDLLQ